MSRSLDGGITWEPSRRADSDAPGDASSFHPQWLAPGNDVALVLWWDDRSGLTDLYVRRSTDGGASWAGPEVRLDPGAPGATVSHAAAWGSAEPGGRVQVTWEEVEPTGGPRRLLRESADLGASWSPVVEASRGSIDPAVVRAVSAAGDTLIVRAQPSPEGNELRALLRPAG